MKAEVKEMLSEPFVRDWLLNRNRESDLTKRALDCSILFSMMAHRIGDPRTNESHNLLIPQLSKGSWVVGTICSDRLPNTQVLRRKILPESLTPGAPPPATGPVVPVVRRFAINLNNAAILVEFNWFESGNLVLTVRSFDSFQPAESHTLHFEASPDQFPRKIFASIVARAEEPRIEMPYEMWPEPFQGPRVAGSHGPGAMSFSCWSDMVASFTTANHGQSTVALTISQDGRRNVMKIQRQFAFSNSHDSRAEGLKAKCLLNFITSDITRVAIPSFETDYYQYNLALESSQSELIRNQSDSVSPDDAMHGGIQTSTVTEPNDNDGRENQVLRKGNAKAKYECHVCHKWFQKKSGVERHVQSMHEQQRPHKCTMCKSAFQQKTHLRVHISTVHEGMTPFQCEHCGVKFSVRSNMLRHVRKVHFDASRPEVGAAT